MIYQVVVKTDSRDLAVADQVYVVTTDSRDADTCSRLCSEDSDSTFQQQVFTLGEVIICDENGRELVGKGRKARKWHVEVEEFLLLSEAVRRAQKV